MTRAFWRSVAALALCTLVAGCITTAEEMAQRNQQRCVNRGLQPNTKEFSDCIAQIENDRDARREANRRAMVERSAAPSLSRGE